MKLLSGLAALFATAQATLTCHWDGSATLSTSTGTHRYLRQASVDGCTGFTFDTDGTDHTFSVPAACMSAVAAPGVGTTSTIKMAFSPNGDVPVLTSTATKDVNCEIKHTYEVEYVFGAVQVGEEELDDTNSNVLSFSIKRFTDASHNFEASPTDMVNTNDMVYLSISANNFNPSTHQFIVVFGKVEQVNVDDYDLFNLSDDNVCVENYTKTKLSKVGDEWHIEFEAFAFEAAGGDDYKIMCSIAVCAAGDSCNWENNGSSVPAVTSTCAADDGLHGF